MPYAGRRSLATYYKCNYADNCCEKKCGFSHIAHGTTLEKLAADLQIPPFRKSLGIGKVHTLTITDPMVFTQRVKSGSSYSHLRFILAQNESGPHSTAPTLHEGMLWDLGQEWPEAQSPPASPYHVPRDCNDCNRDAETLLAHQVLANAFAVDNATSSEVLLNLNREYESAT
jgi:hypothetical protein